MTLLSPAPPQIPIRVYLPPPSPDEIIRTTMASTNPSETPPTNAPPTDSTAPPAPAADPLSNFANLPFFPSPDPSAVSLLWNVAQPFLTAVSSQENGPDGILFHSSPPPSNEAAAVDAESTMRAYEFLSAVSLRVDSLEMAVRYAGMSGMGQQLMNGEINGGEESWNVLMPQVMDVFGAVSIASYLCKDEPHKITTSGILPTLLRLIDTTITISSPPDLHSKLNKGNILELTAKASKSNGSKQPSATTSTHCLTPFHPEFLQCCILSHQFRYAQRFLRNHPVYTHSLLLSSNNAMNSSNPNHARFDAMSYLRFHYYSGLIHMKCEDWHSALSSFHLCLTIPCIGSSLSSVSPISIAARKKMLLIRCWLLEADEMDGPSGANANNNGGGSQEQQRKPVATGKAKKNRVENKVFEMPGAASQGMCRYMSNPTKRVGDDGRSTGSNAPERAGAGGADTGEEKREGFHSMRRKHRHHPSSSSEGGGPNDRGPPLTSGQLKNIRQLGQYHDLVSTFITGISSHYATLLGEMHDLLVTDGNWEFAKRLEGRLAYRAVREVASVYSVIGMGSLEKMVRDSCGSLAQEIMGSRNRAEDALAGMAACDWEDVLVSDPFYASIDQKTGVVTFVEDDSDADANEEVEEQWLEYDLSKRMESCIVLAERVRDLDIQLSTSAKYQQQVAKWEVKGESSMKQGQGVVDVGHSPMDVGSDW